MDILFGDWLPKTRPAGAGFELRIRIEEGRVAADAPIQALIVQVPILPGKGPLRGGVARDGESIR